VLSTCIIGVAVSTTVVLWDGICFTVLGPRSLCYGVRYFALLNSFYLSSAVVKSSCGHIFWFVAIMVNANLLWNVFVWVRVFEKRLLVFRCAWYMYCTNLVVQSRL